MCLADRADDRQAEPGAAAVIVFVVDRTTPAGRSSTIAGAVLGQPGPDVLASAFAATRALADRVTAAA
jgi:hypothetical protein